MLKHHSFRIVPHLNVGPLRNSKGVLIGVAEIGDIWIIRWMRPNDPENHSRYLNDRKEVSKFLHYLNT